MSTRSKLWCLGVGLCLAALVLADLILPFSFPLTAVSDVIQCLLLASGTLAFVPLALRSRGRIRLFWTLMTLGIAFWFSYQLLWTYFEVFLRRDVPDLFAGDIVLFVHIVPLMAALGLRPHVPRDEYAARTRGLDFALLVVWWVYLYVLIVMPWQYAVPNETAYSENLNKVYLAEKLVFLVALAACWRTSKGTWRKLYANVFGASLLYSASSYIANWAIARDAYYSGSLYDIPLAVSMAWISWIGLWTKTPEPEPAAEKASPGYGVWVARAGMIATFSLPLFAAGALWDTAVPTRVRSFRLVLTLAAAAVLGVMVFVRQYLLDRELVRLLGQSRKSFESLKRLQAQIVQSEKMASIGQLVGGAAHELNNPITAMLGYSDLLLGTTLTAEQQSLATKIGRHVRRTRSLVASLLSFARQSPVSKNPVDLNMLARTAVKLSQPQAQAVKAQVRMEFDPAIPKVLGDSNQLLQVCVQIVGNALDALDERRGRVLVVSTGSRTGFALLKVWEDSPLAPGDATTPPAEYRNALSLSACEGIVQEHQGRIRCEPTQNGGAMVQVELPVIPLAAPGARESAPLRAQSQPFA